MTEKLQKELETKNDTIRSPTDKVTKYNSQQTGRRDLRSNLDAELLEERSKSKSLEEALIAERLAMTDLLEKFTALQEALEHEREQTREAAQSPRGCAVQHFNGEHTTGRSLAEELGSMPTYTTEQGKEAESHISVRSCAVTFRGMLMGYLHRP